MVTGITNTVPFLNLNKQAEEFWELKTIYLMLLKLTVKWSLKTSMVGLKIFKTFNTRNENKTSDGIHTLRKSFMENQQFLNIDRKMSLMSMGRLFQETAVETKKQCFLIVAPQFLTRSSSFCPHDMVGQDSSIWETQSRR